MSESAPEPSGAGETPSGHRAGPSAGAQLRRAREAAGLHIAALAVSLKVPVRKLEALESDRLDQLPDAVFVRGLASSVCRALKIDPAPILSCLPQTATPRLDADRVGINAPFRGASDVRSGAGLERLGKPMLAAVALLAVGALAIVFWPARFGEPEGTQAAEQAAQPASPSIPPVAAPALPPDGGAAPRTGEYATTALTPGLPRDAAAPVAAPAVATPAAAPPAVAQAQAPASAAMPPVGGIVVFQVSGPSWIEVVDAKGQVPLRRLLSDGESAGASGTLPLSVTVGRADATQVKVRGKAYDLGPVSRENVARFEVR